jgi:Protein of unknown function (DUF2800)
MTPETDKTQRGDWTSASSAQADSLCAGRYQAQKGLKSSPDAPEAAWAGGGDEIHKALARQQDGALTAAQQGVYDACMRIEQELLIRLFGPEVVNLKSVPFREKRLWLEFNGLRHSGQADVIYRMGPKLAVFDYKTLTGETPSSPTNMQLRDLAVLAWKNGALVTEVAVVVIQPLVTMKPDMCLYTVEHLERALSEMAARVTASHATDAKRTAGESQCKYCRARFTCPEYAKWSSSTVPQLNILNVPVADWTPDQCVTFCNNKARAQKWLDECELAMKGRLTADPQSIPGWKLKPGRIRETVTNPQSVFERFSARGGTLEQFMSVIAVGKVKLKEQLKLVTKEKGKALDESIGKLLEGLTVESQDSPSLEADK